MELHKNIKNRRIELNLSQSELASKVGYKDKGSISRIENGTLDLTQSQIEKFAKALECTPAYLMGWENKTQEQELIDTLDRVKDIIKSAVVLNMTKEEAQIIEKIRLLDERGRKHVLNTLEDELAYLRISSYAKGIGGRKDEST